MRALCFGALAVVSALALAGCSHQATPQLAPACLDLSGTACVVSPAAEQPTPPAMEIARKSSTPIARRAALQRRHARAARKRAQSHAVAAAKPISKPVAKPVDTLVPTSRPDAAPPSASAPAAKTEPGAEVPPNPAKVQSVVAVAAELAERMTALRVPEEPADAHLVAVLLARPAVHGLADLSGKVIAIDERYAKSNAKITAAMNAAGAAEVLLLEGQATAITRLTNGEVSAAVVALASPEAAEAFPKIAGFRLFSVVLKP